MCSISACLVSLQSSVVVVVVYFKCVHANSLVYEPTHLSHIVVLDTAFMEHIPRCGIERTVRHEQSKRDALGTRLSGLEERKYFSLSRYRSKL